MHWTIMPAVIAATVSGAVAQSGFDLNNTWGVGSGSYSAQASLPGGDTAFDSDSFDGFFDTSGASLNTAGAQYVDGGTSGGINDLVGVEAYADVALNGRIDDGLGNITLERGATLSISLSAYGFADGFRDIVHSEGQAALSGRIRLVINDDLEVETSGSTSSSNSSGAASVGLFSLPNLSGGVLRAGTYDIDFNSFVSVDSDGVDNASASIYWELTVVPAPGASVCFLSLAVVSGRRRRC